MLFPKLSVYLSIWGFCENGCWSLNLSMCMYSLVFDVWFYCIVWYDAWFYNTMFDAWFYYIVRWMLIVMLILSLSLVHILTTQISQSQALVHKTITLPWIPHVLKVEGCDSNMPKSEYKYCKRKYNCHPKPQGIGHVVPRSMSHESWDPEFKTS